MKILLVLLGTIFLPASIAIAASNETLRVFYEISAEVEGNSSLIRTSKNVAFGTPVNHEFGEYQLSLLFEPGEPEHYTLKTSLNAISPTTKSIVYTMLSESFSGRISSQSDFSQSEFTIEESGINISIVLRLSRVN